MLKKRAIKLLLDPNNQTAIVDIIKSYDAWKNRSPNLESLNSKTVEGFIKDSLKTDVYEVIESNDVEIKAIRKLSTGEIFRQGDSFWCTNTYEHNPETVENGGYKVTGLYFDEALTGCSYFSGSYYINYVRGNSGLFNLSEITTMDNAPLTNKRKRILLT